jgi:RNA recognition motif-containing protein
MEQNRRLLISGLPKCENQAQAEAIIRKLFSGFQVQMISKVIAPRTTFNTPPPGNLYYAFVDFETTESARLALRAVDGRELEGTKLRVSIPKSRPRNAEVDGTSGPRSPLNTTPQTRSVGNDRQKLAMAASSSWWRPGSGPAQYVS